MGSGRQIEANEGLRRGQSVEGAKFPWRGEVVFSAARVAVD